MVAFGVAAKLIELVKHEAHLKKRTYTAAAAAETRPDRTTELCISQRHINNLSEINWLTGKINKLSAEFDKCLIHTHNTQYEGFFLFCQYCWRRKRHD